jgi:hypothetical protein
MTKKTTTAGNVAANVDEQPWTVAFENRSTEAFEAAMAPDVVLNASILVKPIAGRDLVKICMGTASTMYEHLTFLAQAKSEGRTTRFAQPSHKQNQLAGRERYSSYLKSNRSWGHACLFGSSRFCSTR